VSNHLNSQPSIDLAGRVEAYIISTPHGISFSNSVVGELIFRVLCSISMIHDVLHKSGTSEFGQLKVLENIFKIKVVSKASYAILLCF
jgi:hypothetical protein